MQSFLNTVSILEYVLFVASSEAQVQDTDAIQIRTRKWDMQDPKKLGYKDSPTNIFY